MWLGKGRVTESLHTWLLPTQFASPFLAVACRVRPLWHYFSFSHTPVSPPFANHPVCLQGEFGRYVWEGFHKGFAALCEGGLILVSCGSAPVPATASVGGVEIRFAMYAPCDMPECARRGCLRGFIPVICFSLFFRNKGSPQRDQHPAPPSCLASCLGRPSLHHVAASRLDRERVRAGFAMCQRSVFRTAGMFVHPGAPFL